MQMAEQRIGLLFSYHATSTCQLFTHQLKHYQLLNHRFRPCFSLHTKSFQYLIDIFEEPDLTSQQIWTSNNICFQCLENCSLAMLNQHYLSWSSATWLIAFRVTLPLREKLYSWVSVYKWLMSVYSGLCDLLDFYLVKFGWPFSPKRKTTLRKWTLISLENCLSVEWAQIQIQSRLERRYLA